jgi:ATP synthase F1 delta subunit
MLILSKIAKPYAEALIDLSGASKLNLSKSVDMFMNMKDISKFINDSTDLKEILNNPTINKEAKKNVLKNIFFRLGTDLNISKLFFLLVDRSRIAIIDEITAIFSKLINTKGDIFFVKIKSATLIPRFPTNLFVKSLRYCYGKRRDCKVKICFERDSKLLGGVTVRVESTFYDASIRGQLGRINELLSN